MNKYIEISEEMTKAKSEYKLRVNPTFIFCHAQYALLLLFVTLGTRYFCFLSFP